MLPRTRPGRRRKTEDSFKWKLDHHCPCPGLQSMWFLGLCNKAGPQHSGVWSASFLNTQGLCAGLE